MAIHDPPLSRGGSWPIGSYAVNRTGEPEHVTSSGQMDEIVTELGRVQRAIERYIQWRRLTTEGGGWREYSGESPAGGHVHISYFDKGGPVSRTLEKMMFERFTDQARRAVVRSREESQAFSHNYVGREHLLLGLIASDGIAGEVLQALGLTLDKAREHVEAIIGRGGQPVAGHVPYSPNAKKVLELSLREALALGHNYIGTEHLLLGLTRSDNVDGPVWQVLDRFGTNIAQVRPRVLDALSTRPGREPQPETERLLDVMETQAVGLVATIGALRAAMSKAKDEPEES